MRCIPVILLLLIVGCKKEEPVQTGTGPYYHETCWKSIGMYGHLKDSFTNEEITGLGIWNYHPWHAVRISDSTGHVVDYYNWEPCGKYPIHKGDYTWVEVYKDQPYWGKWQVGLLNKEDGDTVNYVQYLSKSSIIELTVIDLTANGQSGRILDFGMEDNTWNYNGSFIDFNTGIDTIIYRYAIPYQNKYLAIGQGNTIFQDTAIYIPPQDTVKVTFELED